jgi:hypothetical protein
MHTLTFVYHTPEAMPISPQLYRVSKGLEHFYYLLLFANDPSRGPKGEVWWPWLNQGFHLEVRNPPPAARADERITVELDDREGRRLKNTVQGGNRAALEALSDLLRELDRVRRGLTAEERQARVRAVRADPTIADKLITPVHQALEIAGCRDGIPAVDYAIDRALGALAASNIKSVEITLA